MSRKAKHVYHGRPWSDIAQTNTNLHLPAIDDPGVTPLTQIQTYISYHGRMDIPEVTSLAQIQTYISYHGPMDNPGVTSRKEIQPTSTPHGRPWSDIAHRNTTHIYPPWTTLE